MRQMPHRSDLVEAFHQLAPRSRRSRCVAAAAIGASLKDWIWAQPEAPLLFSDVPAARAGNGHAVQSTPDETRLAAELLFAVSRRSTERAWSLTARFLLGDYSDVGELGDLASSSSGRIEVQIAALGWRAAGEAQRALASSITAASSGIPSVRDSALLSGIRLAESLGSQALRRDLTRRLRRHHGRDAEGVASSQALLADKRVEAGVVFGALDNAPVHLR